MRRTAVLIAAGMWLAASESLAGTWIVRPGESIQAAVDAALAGDTVVVQPGVYTEAGRPCPHDPTLTCAVVIGKNGLKLRGGREPWKFVILRGAAGQHVGVGVGSPGAEGTECLANPSARIRDVAVEGLAIEGFARGGIAARCTEAVWIGHNQIIGGEGHGVAQVYGVGGRLTRNVVSEADEAAIYVAAGRDAVVDRNMAFSSGTGIGLVNASDAMVNFNVVFDNATGILALAQGGAPLPANERNAVEDNYVFGNNRANGCRNGGPGLCAAPKGTGILLLGSRSGRALRNNVTANRTIGIGIADLCTAMALGPGNCAALGFDTASTGNEVRSNSVLGNGLGGRSSEPGFLYNDLAWDLLGTGNCWAANDSFTAFPPHILLPRCP